VTPPHQLLRIAVVVDAIVAPTWIAALVDRLTASSGFDVTVFVDEHARRTTRPWLYSAYERADARLFRQRDDAFAPALLARPRPVSTLQPCDVIVHLGSADAASLVHAASFGVWVLSHTYDELRRQVPPLFWEMQRRQVYRTQLDAYLGGGGRRMLYRSYGWPDATSLHRSRNEAYWKAYSAIANTLGQLQRRGRPYLDSRPQAAADRRSEAGGPPSAANVAAHVVKAAVGVLARRARKLVLKEEWFIAVRRANAGSLVQEAAASGRIRGFRAVMSGTHEHFADPFPFEDGRDTYIFFERYDETVGRASIAYARLDHSASPVGPLGAALSPGYHVSYPFVFRHQGDVFMIPESLADGTVGLYRAVGFPSHWVLERNLFTQLRAVDATLLEDEQRLWLFVNVAERGASVNDELHLYSSTTIDGPWIAHPENPVVSDTRSARPAGRIFTYEGELIRPSQDCSRGYGRALVFNRVDVLTDDEYKETPIARLERGWAPGVRATHTYNASDLLETIDGRRFVLRAPLGRVAARARRSRR
jgi:hypothetical protein